MQTAESLRIRQLSAAPVISCELLPLFDCAELESVRLAFQCATPCSFRQAWLDREAGNFSPGTVRVGWRESTLLIFAELTDADIFNGATQLNQHAWELGDVLEIFLGEVGNENYTELQITPENQRLQLCFPNATAVASARKTGSFENFLIPGEAFHSRTWINRQNGQWFVYAEVPASIVSGCNRPIANTQWRFSFSRYDYTRGVKEPVISSTSPHAEADFHRQHEWGAMTFNNSFAIQSR
jgi:hypothetical protein